MEHGVNLISELICLPVDHLYEGVWTKLLLVTWTPCSDVLHANRPGSPT